MTVNKTFRILAMAGVLLFGGAAHAVAQEIHMPFAALLKTYVVPYPDGINRVAYADWHADKPSIAALDQYVTSLTKLKPAALPKPEAFAYWANLYNALTLQVILRAYPVKSIRDIKSENWLDPKAWLGPWRTERVTVEGTKLSLDDIEHKILRPTFKDPRIHYAVNCASIGCPNLMPRPWMAATLEVDLDAAARAFIKTPRAVTRLPDGSLRLSSIYKWFAEDFGTTDAAVIEHLRKFADTETASKLANAAKISEDQYDWSLNEHPATGKRP